MLVSIILAVAVVAAAIHQFHAAKIVVGKNELVIMARDSRKGSSVEVISTAGVHRRPSLLGWRLALRISTSRQNAQFTTTVGPEATKTAFDITLRSTGNKHGVEGAQRLYSLLRSDPSTKDQPTSAATRRREEAVSIVRDAIVRALAEATYEEALKLLNEGIVGLIAEQVKSPLNELAFVLDKVNIMSVELGETRRTVLHEETLNNARRAQEDIEADRQLAARGVQMAAELEAKQHQAALAALDGERLIAHGKSQEIAAGHEATARDLRLRPINGVLAALERLGLTGELTYQLISSVVNTSGPRSKNVPTAPLVGSEAITSEMPVVTQEEAATALGIDTGAPASHGG